MLSIFLLCKMRLNVLLSIGYFSAFDLSLNSGDPKSCVSNISNEQRRMIAPLCNLTTISSGTKESRSAIHEMNSMVEVDFPRIQIKLNTRTLVYT